jgi:hypothetical protein
MKTNNKQLTARFTSPRLIKKYPVIYIRRKYGKPEAPATEPASGAPFTPGQTKYVSNGYVATGYVTTQQ